MTVATNSNTLKSVGRWLPQPVLTSLRRYRDASFKAEISAILARTETPQTERAENDFGRLQSEFRGVPEYGYDPHSLWKRGSERALALSEMLADKNEFCDVLEVGCGDGMAGYLLSIHGHRVTLSDMDDWRDARAKSMKFCERILEEGLHYDDGSFDLIFSYNSFEHFRDPAACFSELTRLARPGAILHLSFGPVYSSAWGLHATPSLRMPYPQFLLSPSFVSERLNELGIYDLGKQMSSLQPLNRWTTRQFCALWSNEDWHVVRADLCGADTIPSCHPALPGML